MREVEKGESLGKYINMPGKWKGYEKESTRLVICRRKKGRGTEKKLETSKDVWDGDCC